MKLDDFVNSLPDGEINKIHRLTPNEVRDESLERITNIVPAFQQKVKELCPNPCLCVKSDLLKTCTDDELRGFLKIAGLLGALLYDGMTDEHLPQVFSEEFIAVMEIEFVFAVKIYAHAEEELARRVLEFEEVG